MGNPSSGSSSGSSSGPSRFKFLNSHSEASHEDGESIWLLSYADLMTLLFSFFALLLSFSKIDIETFEKSRKETTQVFGGEYKVPSQKLKEDMKAELKGKGLTDQAFFEDFTKGMTITFRGSLFFDSGSAELKEEARNLLEKIIPIIKNQKTNFLILVEGHTDDNPISEFQSNGKFPSNWELSSHRASSVLRLFEKGGFAKQSLRSIGYAETKPIVANRDDENKVVPENQALNRRVVIRLIRTQL